MAQTDPRSPHEIASFATKFEADAVAAVIKAEGIDAAVFGRGGAVSGWIDGMGEWAVMVPAEEAERARHIVLEARESHGEAAALVYCPGCGYSMAGLPDAGRCPECGHDLDAARVDMRTRGIRQVAPESAAGPLTAWKWLLVGLGVCAVVGVLSLTPVHLMSWYIWWFSAGLGLVVFVVGVVVVVRRRWCRKSPPHREM